MGRRTRKRRSSAARGHPLLVVLAVLGGVAVAGYLLGRESLLAGAVLIAGVILLVKFAFWRHRRRAKLAAARSLSKMLALSPPAFEETTAELLRALGYRQMRRIGGPGDRGVDLTGRDDKGRAVVVQCKRYAPGRHIGSPLIQSFIGMIVQHQAERGLFVTTSDFTRPAIDLARDAPVPLILIDGHEIVRLAAAVKLRGADAADLIEQPLPAAERRPYPSPASSRRRQSRPANGVAARPASYQVCPACGHHCQATDRFCGHCGATLIRSGRRPIAPEIAGFPPREIEDHPW